MFFASKYAFRKAKNEVEEVDEDDLQASLQDNLEAKAERRASLKADEPMNIELPPEPQQPQQEPQQQGFFARLFGSAPAGVAQQQAKPKEVRRNKKKVIQREVDANVVSIKFKTLAASADALFAGDPTFCKGCKAALSSTSTLEKGQDFKKKREAAKLDLKNLPVIIESQEPKVEAKSVEAKPAEAKPAEAKAEVKVEAKPLESSAEKLAKLEIDDDQYLWVCEFCDEVNVLDIDAEEIPKTESRDYVIAPAPEKKEEVKGDAETNIIFCIDVSGSMCVTTEVSGTFKLKGAKKQPTAADFGIADADFQIPQSRRNVTYVSRLQCVQAAIDKQLETMHKEHPNKIVGLVTFNNEVTIYGDGTTEPEVIAGDKLSNQKQLQSIGEKYSLTKPISGTRDTLSDKLFAFQEGGQTALGPALLVSVMMAAKKNGSQVVVCTDGLANIGLGALDFGKKKKKEDTATDKERQDIEKWYEGVGNLAKLHGVTVSVVSLKGDECALEDLGTVADITGGHVDRVDPLDLTKNFSSILANPVIATQVSATFHLHRGMRFRNEDQETNKIVKEVGNVSEDSEMLFEYTFAPDAVKDFSHLKTLPFQVQIRFTKPDGMKCLRVYSKAQEITDKREEAEKDLRYDLLAANVQHQSAKMAAKGDYAMSRANNVAWGRFMNKNAKAAPQQQVYSKFVQNLSEFDNVLQRQQVKLDKVLVEQNLVSSDDEEAEAFAAPVLDDLVVPKNLEVAEKKASVRAIVAPPSAAPQLSAAPKPSAAVAASMDVKPVFARKKSSEHQEAKKKAILRVAKKERDDESYNLLFKMKNASSKQYQQ